MNVEIYTDGACSGNPGPGGYGAVLSYKTVTKELSGFASATTNNRMELTAVIEALKALKRRCTVNLYTDSRYVSDGATKWLAGWMKNGFKKSDGKKILNQDLWQELYHLLQAHDVTFIWVKGHAGNPMNERVDALARGAIENNVNIS